ncbi:MAG: hypothetical protein OEV08_13205, partial [Nitrospira sp.]|nr:hypothetical protein [Nitrospira sp.]
RVLLANHRTMIPDAIRELLAEQQDMEVVGDVRGPMRILQETGRVQADVVILAHEESIELGLSSQLLTVYPDLIVLQVTQDMNVASMEQLCAHRRTVTSGTHQEIIEMLKTVARGQCSRSTSI